MTPEERQLIAGLFERMRSYGTPDKDREAEALITQSVRANPDAPYMLVQSVLVQEQALQAANDRVTQLEDELRAVRGDERPPARSGGFLSGVWNSGRRGDEPRSSVPQVGSRAAPPAYEDRGTPWSQSAPPPQQQAPQAAGGGGFMKSALATAAGVAGGMLVADSLRNMLGGAHASPSHLGGPRESEATEHVDERDNDPGNYEDDGNDPGFADDPGGDDGIEV
jgi:uncharacterized protein